MVDTHGLERQFAMADLAPATRSTQKRLKAARLHGVGVMPVVLAVVRIVTLSHLGRAGPAARINPVPPLPILPEALGSLGLADQFQGCPRAALTAGAGQGFEIDIRKRVNQQAFLCSGCHIRLWA